MPPASLEPDSIFAAQMQTRVNAIQQMDAALADKQAELLGTPTPAAGYIASLADGFEAGPQFLPRIAPQNPEAVESITSWDPVAAHHDFLDGLIRDGAFNGAPLSVNLQQQLRLAVLKDELSALEPSSPEAIALQRRIAVLELVSQLSNSEKASPEASLADRIYSAAPANVQLKQTLGSIESIVFDGDITPDTLDTLKELHEAIDDAPVGWQNQLANTPVGYNPWSNYHHFLDEVSKQVEPDSPAYALIQELHQGLYAQESAEQRLA